MALILARKIRQYRSIVSILQKPSKDFRSRALAIEARTPRRSKDDERNTISNRTGAAGILHPSS